MARRDLFHQVRKEWEAGVEPRMAMLLVATARHIGLNDEAFEMAAQRCKAAEEGGGAPGQAENGNAETFVEALYPEEVDRQMYWYKLLRKNGKTPAAALAMMRGMAERNLPEKDFRDVVGQAILMLNDPDSGQEIPETEAVRAAYISDTLYRYGNPTLTKPMLEKLAAKSKGPDPLLRLGDMAADLQDWATAAGQYAAAFGKDNTQPALLYLSGAALVRAGKDAEGHAAEDRADGMMLAQEMQRYVAAVMLTQRGFADDADKQYEKIVRTGDFRSAVLNRAVTMLQTHYADGGNVAGGWVMAQRAAADVLSFQGNSVMTSNMLLGTPQPLYESRAQRAIAAGDLPAAQDAIAAAAALVPLDMTVELGVIGPLEKAGHKELADKAFERLWDVMQQQLKEHPNFPVILNNLAWLCAKTGRHPAEALGFAKKAVALRPDETQDIDTLAETLFINGQVKEALAAERRALLLDPAEGFFRQQIERFEKK